MCQGCSIYLFLRNELLTSDAKPYIIGTVTLIEQLSTGAIEVTFTYDDATLPLDEGEPIEIVFGVDGTVCDPDCGEACSWLAKVLAIVNSATISGLQNRHEILYAENQVVESGVFSIPRIPFTGGFQLTSMRLSCFTYNENTQGTFRVKVDGITIAEFMGTLEEQRVMNLTPGLETIAYDKLPIVELIDVEQVVYGEFALGLVIEFLGVLL